MAKFWCKVCGQQLDPIDSAVVATCGSCGARQVLPVSLSSEYLKYYAELVILQQSEQFEKAEELFEHLILEGGADAALYWLGVLIDYRAVYIRENEDYTIRCGIVGETSVVENESFQKVLHYASPAQRGIFEKDGRILEESRLEMSGKYNAEIYSELPLNRGFLCLEDGAWDAAEAQFDRVLSDEPDNALAYFGKMMAELQVHREGELSQTGTRLSETENYENVLKYGDEILCERLKKYREAGILYQATEHGKCAETIDDWRHVKKLLMEIRSNERASEYLALCDRKIRAIMVREAQLVMGCREAVNLGLTTETLGTRMVSANYYYDFDMSEKSDSKAQRRIILPSSRVVAIFSLIIMIILALIFSISFFLSDDEDSGKVIQGENQEYSYSDSIADNGINDENRILHSTTEKSLSCEDELCIVGTMAFTLDNNGKVVCLNEFYEEESHEGTQNGASFVINATPYESDFSTWSDVTRLYSDPDGAMLFGVMENGTVSYDIFSSSKMNYEAKYRSVSSWMNVQELFWDEGNVQNPCLFAVTKKGDIYVSDDEAEKIVRQMVDLIKTQGLNIESYRSKNNTLHILTKEGSYSFIKYR